MDIHMCLLNVAAHTHTGPVSLPVILPYESWCFDIICEEGWCSRFVEFRLWHSKTPREFFCLFPDRETDYEI